MKEASDGSFEVARDHDGRESTYGELAREVNVLMIKYRLGIDEEAGLLVPICPQFTLRRSVTFANDHPMELVSGSANPAPPHNPPHPRLPPPPAHLPTPQPAPLTTLANPQGVSYGEEFWSLVWERQQEQEEG